MKPTDALPHPPHWKTTTVGKAIEVKRGISWSKKQEYSTPQPHALPVIRIGNVQKTLDLDDIIYISDLNAKTVEKKRVEAGWSVMVGSNGNRHRIGNAVLIEKETEFLFASFLIAAKPLAGSGIDPGYFSRWLRTEQVQAYLTASAEGSTGLCNLSHSFFRSMAIPYPSIDEQEAIDQLLGRIDDAISAAHAAVAGSKQIISTLLNDLIVLQPKSLLPESLGNHISAGPTNGIYRPESDYGEQGTPIVRIDSFNDGVIANPAKLRRVSLPIVLQTRFALSQSDILINRVNALAHVGKAAIVPKLAELTVFESNMMRLCCGPHLRPGYLLLVLRSDISRRHWLSRAKAAVNQVSINQRDVKELKFPVPSLENQKSIITTVSAADQVLWSQQERLERLIELKQSLMHDLLTGQVRVDPALFAA